MDEIDGTPYDLPRHVRDEGSVFRFVLQTTKSEGRTQTRGKTSFVTKQRRLKNIKTSSLSIYGR